MRTSMRVAILVSMALTALLAVLLVFLTLRVETLIEVLLTVARFLIGGTEATAETHTILRILAYLMSAAAFAALAGLFLLLGTVLHGQVFSRKTLGCLLTVALCCFAEAALMLVTGRYFLTSYLAAAIFLFIGLCLTVVRTVIAEAMRIKQENDLTV